MSEAAKVLQQLQQGALGISDAGFWTTDDVTFDTKKTLLGSLRGVLLDGPRKLSIQERDDIRCLALRGASEAEAKRVSFRGKATVVATRLETNEVHAGWAIEGTHPREPIARKTKPAVDPELAEWADLLEPVTLMTFRLNVRQQLARLPWKPGTYRTWVLLHDACSNPVTTEVVRQEVNDPEVEKFLDGMRRPALVEPVEPPAGNPIPSYVKDAASPAIPREPGIALTADRVVLHTEDARCILRGSFRLPVHDRDRVREARQGERAFLVHGERPSAILPISLVLTGDAFAQPTVVSLRVPTFDALPAEQAMATGHFTVDLVQLAPALSDQTYAIWAVAGGTLSGPWLSAFVDPAMLPKPGE